MSKRVAILISGGGSNMLALVDSMTGDHPARPCLVMSNDPGAAGLKRAADLGIPVAAVDHRPFKGDRPAFEAALMEPLRAAAPDILCLAGFMRVLTAGFVSQWQGRMLNIHPSLLPKYKGLQTHARALAAGDAEHGCSVHEVTAALDDGPILGQARLAIDPQDNAESLAARVLKLEHRLYPMVLRRFADGDRRPVLLDETSASGGLANSVQSQ
ncbi:MAG: phosphoribosylglycinamide formyltransferase [Aestuariivita sp.]|uniref:phosphoribosylglycinamide formyltransferase n=1 Tax=Aestuariivita sp. TaxID=1872407 RepID=UPI003BAE377D